MYIRFISVLLIVFNLSSFAALSSDDYHYADSLVNNYASLIYNKVNTVHVVDASTFWYKTKTQDGVSYIFVDAAKQIKTPIFKNDDLLTALTAQEGEELTWANLHLTEEHINAKIDSFRFVYHDYHYLYLVRKGKLIKQDKRKTTPAPAHWAIARKELGQDAIPSPDGKYKAYIKEYNLYVQDIASSQETQMTFDGAPGEYYSSFIKWSPNSAYIAVHKFRTAPKRFIQFMESAPKDQWQPKLQEVEYFKPGDALPIKQAYLFSIATHSAIPVDMSPYLTQFSLTDPVWRADSRAFTVEYNQRGHQQYDVLEVAATTGKVNVLAQEKLETFFPYSVKRFRKDINDGSEMIWMSERDGWNHLYLIDAKGKVKNQITKGQWVVRNVVHVDEEKRTILFAASGMTEGEDPYHLHYYTIDFDGRNLKSHTPEKADHKVTFSSDYSYFIDYYSRADLPGQTVLRSTTDAQQLLVLETTNIQSLKATAWQQPEVFSAKGRDNETDIWGIIYRPSNFDPNKKYPVVEYIYAGPHDSFVPKSFLGVDRRIANLLELGFVCVRIDGMGTSNRSKAFHDVCWHNIKDAGFPDRIKWMQAAAAQYPYIDIDRVGIFGGSAGGQSSTGALLFHPEFYDVAVSSCGCHDNRMDKIWWNEQWMGYPVEAHYDSCSNVVNAHKLQGNLMLILGEIDDNVDPASTIQVVDALIQANKEFEFVMLPGFKHTLGGTYGDRKRRDFFVKHLMHDATPNWNIK